MARRLVALGLADVAAADNHGDWRTVSAAWNLIRDSGSPGAAERLCRVNPRAVVEDRDMESVPPAALRESVWSRVKDLMGI